MVVTNAVGSDASFRGYIFDGLSKAGNIGYNR
jgi:hypothetical protein